MDKILVTGKTGQLGSELEVLSKKYPNWKWIFADREKVTLSDLDLLEKQLKDIAPSIIINCAAYTAVDKAETDKELAETINHLAVKVIAKYAEQNKCKLIHISTDYVFDGTSSSALKEDEVTNPINVYGETKRAGEIACIAENPSAIIIRTSWVYSRYGNNFVKTMQRLMSEREEVNVVNDQIGSPTAAIDLAKTILTILTSRNWYPGIYNFSNEGEISWFEFATAIKEIGGYSCTINGIPSSVYPTPAKRPQYSLLNKDKIKQTYSILIPDFKISLEKVLLE